MTAALALLPTSAYALRGPDIKLPTNELDPICRTSGNRVVMVYKGSGSVPYETIRSVARRMTWKIADQSSITSNGKRVVRMAVDCDAEGNISVFTSQTFGEPEGVEAVKYLEFMPETNGVHGIAYYAFKDEEKSRQNYHASTTGRARFSNAEGEGWNRHASIHELFHLMGAVQHEAPDATSTFHCKDGLDIMCYEPEQGYVETTCPASEGYDTPTNVPLDCDHDSYFNADPPNGSYLDEHWNVAGPENPFLSALPTKAPKASTGTATGISDEYATLNGTVTPESDYAFYHFQYGTTTSYGSSAPSPKMGVLGYGGTAVSESTKVEGLKPNTTYHYRIVGTNDLGEVGYGEDKTFTTADYRPLAKTVSIPPEETTSGESWLGGEVNPQGFASTYHFEFVSDADFQEDGFTYAKRSPATDGSVASGATDSKYHLVGAFTGLTLEPNTTYHYRVVATNVKGTRISEAATFRTRQVLPIPYEYDVYGSSGSGNGQFSDMGGIAIDFEGNLWIADTGNSRLQKLAPDGTYLSKFGKHGSGHNEFLSPEDVATLGGTIWVIDSGRHQLLRFSKEGNWISELGSQGTGNGQYEEPYGIAAGNNKIWVSDFALDRLQQFDSSGKYIRTVTGGGENGPALEGPMDLAVDAEGNVWVADMTGDRVLGYTSEGDYIGQVGSPGEGEGEFQAPNAIAMLPSGNLAVGDGGDEKSNGRIQVFSPSGNYLGTVWDEWAMFSGIAAVDNLIFATNFTELKRWNIPQVEATTGAGYGINPTKAKLIGTVDPNGSEAEYIFEYGTSKAYGDVAPESSEAVGSEPEEVQYELTGLSASTTYHYRVVAMNEYGVSYGADKTFTTSPPPTATTDAATAMAETGATLNATVNPHGTATSYRFEYGLGTGYGTKVPIPNEAIGSGESPVKVDEAISGLAKDTIYHYRVAATSTAGTTYGEDRTFTTYQGRWHIGSKTLEELSLKGEDVGGEGSFQMHMPEWGITITCDELTIGELLPEGRLEVEMFLSNCEIPESECSISVPDPARLSGTAERLYSQTHDLISLEVTGACFLEGNWNPLPPEEGFEVEYGPNGVTVSADTSGVGSIGEELMEYESSSSWFLIGAKSGQTFGLEAVAPPSATTQSATSVTTTSATLKGSVNPNGFATTYRFEYGPTTSYGTKVPVPDEAIGSGKSAVSVSKPISGLSAETTYHYRVVATNVGGITYGADETLTTEAKGSDPRFSFIFGSQGSGNGQFQEIQGIALDSSGNVWVADPNNSRLQKFNSSGTYQSQFTGDEEHYGVLGPHGIEFDASGNLWIVETEAQRLTKYNSNGEFLLEVGALFEEGSANGQFSNPKDLAIDSSGNVWVADTGNNRIQKFNSSGEYLSKFGSYGTGNGQFNQPSGIDIDSSGNVWVTDYGNSRVQKFNSSGTYQSQFGTKGTGNGQFEFPHGIEIDSSGSIWVTDVLNPRVQEFSSSGEYLSQFGTEGSGEDQFREPTVLAAGSGGSVWVGDNYNRKVSKWVP